MSLRCSIFTSSFLCLKDAKVLDSPSGSLPNLLQQSVSNKVIVVSFPLPKLLLVTHDWVKNPIVNIDVYPLFEQQLHSLNSPILHRASLPRTATAKDPCSLYPRQRHPR